jgi:hypothetical protein
MLKQPGSFWPHRAANPETSLSLIVDLGASSVERSAGALLVILAGLERGGVSMRFGHLSHALELEMVSWHLARWMRGAKAFLGMAAVNPDGSESHFVSREMIVKQTLSRVQNLMLLVPRIIKFLDHVFKIAQIGLI